MTVTNSIFAEPRNQTGTTTIRPNRSISTDVSSSTPTQPETSWIPGVALATLLSLQGTGGNVPTLRFHLSPVSGSDIFEYTSGRRKKSDLPVAEPSQLTSLIRLNLGITISDLASILRVQRPTVYEWLSENTAPRAKNIERLRDMYQVAREWRKLTTKPIGSRINHKLSDGKSLFELLQTEQVDLGAIRPYLIELSRVLDDAALASKNLSIASKLKSAGYSPKPSDEHAVSVRRLSSKASIDVD